MLSGEALTYDDGTEVEFLVNFQRKKRELEERGVEIRQQERGVADDGSASVFTGRREEDTPLIVHYDPSEEPGRMFGASHIPLPVHDEEARQKMLADLKRMTDETDRKRRKRAKKLDAKSLADQERLNQLRAEKVGFFYYVVMWEYFRLSFRDCHHWTSPAVAVNRKRARVT